MFINNVIVLAAMGTGGALQGQEELCSSCSGLTLHSTYCEKIVSLILLIIRTAMKSRGDELWRVTGNMTDFTH